MKSKPAPRKKKSSSTKVLQRKLRKDGIKKAMKELEVFQVFRDCNGIVYLRVAYSNKGAHFIVNKGFSVELVDIDANSTHGHHLAMRAVPNASIVETAKRLLHPLNDQITISQRAKEYLVQILQTKELQMKATVSATPATRPPKFATVTAPPAAKARTTKATPAKGKAAQSQTPPTKGKAASAAQRTPRATDEVYQTKVVYTGKEVREGTFFATVANLAKKPIILDTLINQVTKEVGKTLKSDKDAATVCRVRTRDAYLKLGFLKAAK